jgi:molybdopterin-binding protein
MANFLSSTLKSILDGKVESSAAVEIRSGRQCMCILATVPVPSPGFTAMDGINYL